MLSLSFLSDHLLLTSTAVLACYIAIKCCYRLYIHPLAKFPGPKLAAITYKYEFYYDGIKDGQYSNHIAELHKKYGMDRQFPNSRNDSESKQDP